MLVPFAPRQFVAYQPIGGIGIGNAQQRLGQTHEHDPFLRGKIVFMHEGVEPAVGLTLFAYGLDQLVCLLGHPRVRNGVDFGLR